MDKMNNVQISEIARRVKDRRIELGLSYSDMVTLCGYSKSTWQRYESGAIENMPMSILPTLARALHVTPAWLLGIDEKKPHATESMELLGEIITGLSPEDQAKVLEMAQLLRLRQEAKK
jgi:transcriptional regulator with XRE-family HTH domain